jgi:hypothetical protein
MEFYKNLLPIQTFQLHGHLYTLYFLAYFEEMFF